MNERAGVAALIAGGMVLIAGCAHSGNARPAAAGGPGATASQAAGAAGSAGAGGAGTGAAPSSPSPSPTATRIPPEARRTLKPGARNADVRALQRRLKELHYDPGTIDG